MAVNMVANIPHVLYESVQKAIESSKVTDKHEIAVICIASSLNLDHRVAEDLATYLEKIFGPFK